VDDVVLDDEGQVKELRVTADKDNAGPKPKGASKTEGCLD